MFRKWISSPLQESKNKSSSITHDADFEYSDEDEEDKEDWERTLRLNSRVRNSVEAALKRDQRLARSHKAQEWKPSLSNDSNDRTSLNSLYSDSNTYSMAPFVPLKRSTFALSRTLGLLRIKDKNQNRIIKQGYILKRNNTSRSVFGRSWNKKYFVVSPGWIYYGKNDKKHRRALALGTSASVSRVNDKDIANRLILNIAGKKQDMSSTSTQSSSTKRLKRSDSDDVGTSIHLRASSVEDLKSWMDAIQIGIDESSTSAFEEDQEIVNEAIPSVELRMNGRDKLVEALRTALMSYSNLRNVNIDESSLIHVASAMTIEQYGSGDNIMSEGTIAKKFYVIHSGHCEVLRSTGTGRLKKEGELSAGQAFGESAVFYGGKRAVTVRAVRDVTVWTIPKAQLLGLFGQKHTTFKERRNVLCRPALVVLPLSPNHGAFGSDGLYV